MAQHNATEYKNGIFVMTPSAAEGSPAAMVDNNAKALTDRDDLLAAAVESVVESLTEGLNVKANASDVYNKTEVDQALLAKANATTVNNHLSNTNNPHATTASQVGAYTKTEADSLLGSKANTSTVTTLSTTVTNHVNSLLNPHMTSAQQVGALPITGGIINGNLGLNGGNLELGNGTLSNVSSIAVGSITTANLDVGNVIADTVNAVGGFGGDGSQLTGITANQIEGLGSAALRDVGTSSGSIPALDANGKLLAAVLPSIAVTDTFVVASQAAMLALVAQTGDVAVRTDLNKTFILKGASASTLADWAELLTPTSPVQSVNGLTGSVVLTASQVGALPITGGTLTGPLSAPNGSTIGQVTYSTNRLTFADGSFLQGSGGSIIYQAGDSTGSASIRAGGTALVLQQGTIGLGWGSRVAAPQGDGKTNPYGFYLNGNSQGSTYQESYFVGSLSLKTTGGTSNVSLDGVTGNVNATGVVTANSFTGNGANLTSLNASNLSSGTVPTARLPDLSATYLPKTGGTLTGKTTVTVNEAYPGQFGVAFSVGSNIQTAFSVNTNGSVTATSFISTGGFQGSGSYLTNLNANALTQGTISPARLPTNADFVCSSLTVNGDVYGVPLLKTLTISHPIPNDSITLFYTKKALTLLSLRSVVVGAGASYWIKWGTNRNGADFAQQIFATSNTTGDVFNGWETDVIPANSWVWYSTDATEQTATELSFVLEYKQ